MPPNVLWICADDYTPDACGAYGNPLARTPNIDRLATQGVRLDRAFAASPLSTPSRQSFWTGRYPRTIGVTLSPTPLPDDEVTLPARLRAAGYETAAFGKTHFYCPRPNEFDISFDIDDHRSWLDNKGPDPLPPDVEVLGPWRPFRDPPERWLNANVLPYPATDRDMFGTYLARHAAEYLERQHDRPFFCYISTYETHSPFNFPADWPNRRCPDEFVAPHVTEADARELPEVFAKLDPQSRCGIIAAYHTCTEFMDRNVGIVLDALDRAKLTDNTLVLFTSDHGYLLGQHGRFEKHSCYDPACRAVVVARWPDRFPAGRRSSALVELPDLAPTVLEACGLSVPPEMQARSLIPLLKGEVESHRDRVLIQYADNAEAAMRTERWKLICCAGTRRRQDGYARPSDPRRWVKLFDLVADPDELTNLAGRSETAAIKAELIAVLADHVQRTGRSGLREPMSRDPREILDRNLDPQDEGIHDYFRRQFQQGTPR